MLLWRIIFSCPIRTKFPGLIIKYTTDGSIPNKNSKIYKFPIKINRMIKFFLEYLMDLVEVETMSNYKY